MASIEINKIWAKHGSFYVVCSTFKHGGMEHQRNGFPYLTWEKTLESMVRWLAKDDVEVPEKLEVYKITIENVSKDVEDLVPFLVKEKLLK